MEYLTERSDEDTDTVSVLEQAIAAMEVSLQCIHPVHYHSFEQVSFLISGPMRGCAGCAKRLRSVLGAGGSDQVVRCIACGVYAHRACARNEETKWTQKCAVNGALLSSEGGKVLISDEQPTSISAISVVEETVDHCESLSQNMQESLTPESKSPLKNVFSSVHNLLSRRDNKVVDSEVSGDQRKQLKQLEKSFVWTDAGPPLHWASSKSMETLKNGVEEELLHENPVEDIDDADDATPMTESTFFAVSRALQENILSHFEKPRTAELDYEVPVHGDEVAESLMTSHDDDSDENSLDERDVRRSIERALINDEKKASLPLSDSQQKEADQKEQAEALSTVIEPTKPKNAVLGLASDAYEAAKISATFRRKLGFATVAGGIAGGVAGLFVAGPAGLFVGAKCGQTVGFIGVALEGTYTIGVFVAGVAGAAAAGFTVAQKLHQHHEKRVLTIGEKECRRKVLLVRPNVWIDPEWDAITAHAKRSIPGDRSSFLGLLSKSPTKQANLAKQERSKRDADIVQTDEFEIPTEDKVLLLVSRSLNCKRTLPGHVYRSLIQEHRNRVERRCSEDMITKGASHSVQRGASDNGMEVDPSAETSRAQREDTHAVIKHVTATLLEVRPGFAHSPKITEMSATAVESLVFGELYDSVICEIIREMKAADDALIAKIESFERDHSVSDISDGAIKALHQIPEAHSVVDKLRFCVAFLERIADHFDGGNLSADSLLKMVCQHICVAKVPNLNAEIAFMEEFARDDQLLRGKEGYALVTLQASLHFLNASKDFEKDIFHEDDN
jgi:Vacuolar sorting protein 9 (VPS9) domain